jgi:hypothetical protein
VLQGLQMTFIDSILSDAGRLQGLGHPNGRNAFEAGCF